MSMLSHAERRARWQARFVALSVFGPYVTGSARTEQIVVFALAAWVLVTGWPRMLIAKCPPAPFLAMWGGMYVVMVIATFSRPFDPGFYGSQPASHALAALAIPIAMLVLTWYWSLSVKPAEILRAAAPVVIAGMCVNTVLEVIQLAAGNATAVGVLPHFWDAPAQAVGSVAANAAQNGRYSGIFGQPAEAGVAYGVALLLVIWVARQGWRPALVIVCAVLLVTGGVITLSKVFLLDALPIAAMTVLHGRARIRVITVTAGVVGLFWLAGSGGVLPGWHLGSVALASLAHPGTSLTTQYSAGRYGAGGILTRRAADILHAAPIAGFGAGGVNLAYDSLWFEVLAVSGIMGLILATAALVVLATQWARLRRSLRSAEWQLAGAVLVLALGASAGLPSLTANRCATLLWLVLGLLVCAQSCAG
jgi:hypothetical protein